MANFIVCNFDDKGCKKSNGYKSMIDALRFTAGYAAAHVSTFYWGRPSHLILCWKISVILFSSLRLQIIPKGIFKFLARKEICFLLFELYFLVLLFASYFSIQKSYSIHLFYEFWFLSFLSSSLVYINLFIFELICM